jgi:hypothetical protein
VPKVVNPKSRADTGLAACGQENGTPPVGQPQHASAGHCEHEIVGRLARDGLGDLASQKPGDRDGPGLVRLRGAQDDAAADVGECAPDVYPAAAQVDIADSQGGCLAPAQARVTEQQNEHSPRTRSVGQIVESVVETAISWLSGGHIEQYMSAHQHDPNANELWSYFQAVIHWVELTFTTYRKEMKGVDWGGLYNQFKDGLYDTAALEDEIKALMIDDDVTMKKASTPTS